MPSVALSTKFIHVQCCVVLCHLAFHCIGFLSIREIHLPDSIQLSSFSLMTRILGQKEILFKLEMDFVYQRR